MLNSTPTRQQGWLKELATQTLPELVRVWVAALGGRRFLLTVGAGAVSSAQVYQGSITPEIYRDIIIATVAAYIAGNTYQKAQNAANP